MSFPQEKILSPAQLAAAGDPLARSGLVVVDKPQNMTSHDVVGRLRRIFGTRKVGHAGTLDPMATGVLVVGIERGTKFLAHLVADTKTYSATIRLGAATTTDDSEGEILTQHDASPISDEQIHAGIERLRGEIMQRPSSVSAIKIQGRRAHELVREGVDVEIPERPVTIFSFEVHAISRTATWVDIDCTVHCSSGTYIRSLARDLGAFLGVGGHLTALRRSAVGPFTLDKATTLEQLEASADLSLSLDQAMAASFSTLSLSPDEATALSMGKWLSPRGLRGVHAGIAPDGRAIALVKEQGKRLSTVFVARPSTL
ncbi:tRNA pseudouridine synthase B [Corynebacterium ciconiae DSM 44920]|uniref:tRNA pseudouridine(55) synthase TruB n=1 Tax=Corynebacterium ciconiae TaxID=227319 RepID=UPI0003616AC1|nr:tRNA pseudouridine(55) synthase TruB [Corynebacterium ciconiae]WKD61436.1 tRNA pseudouridine synthase B [Corynebacterium ciconiae DSM 44920]